MYKINEVKLDYETREKILPHMTRYPGEPEMSYLDSAFMCGLLKESRPRKILEVGVAGGVLQV